MWSFRRAVIHLLARPYATTRRIACMPRDRHYAGWREPYNVPLIGQSQRIARAPEPAEAGTQRKAARTPRHARAVLMQALDMAAKALPGFLLWIGLLLSAAMVGTFIVLFLTIAYALSMSATGH